MKGGLPMSPSTSTHVLQLDIQGTPQAWITVEQAAIHLASASVAWVDGDGPLRRLRGGVNARTGRPSVMEIFPIMALNGASRINLFEVAPSLNRLKLFRRDRCVCAYCGDRFSEGVLQCEHIVPASRGGATSWMNLVTACPMCPVDSKTSCCKAGTSGPMYTSGWLRACQKDRARTERFKRQRVCRER